MSAVKQGIALLAVAGLIAFAARPAHAECRCVSIAADVGATVQVDALRADSLYAKGDFSGALELYVKGYAASKDASFLYAEAMCQWQLGRAADAKALLEQYLGASGQLAFRARAEGALDDVRAGVTASVGGAIGAVGAVGGGAEGFVGGSVDTGADLVGSVRAKAEPPKIAKTGAIVVGVLAVVAVGVVATQSIRAGLSDSIDIDPSMDLSLGASALVLGGTAFYLGGLTAASGAVGGAGGNLHCVAPVAYPGGGGIAALATF